jgi:hypothetical protein
MLVYEPPGLRQGKLLALATSNALPGSQKVVQAIARLGRVSAMMEHLQIIGAAVFRASEATPLEF